MRPGCSRRACAERVALQYKFVELSIVSDDTLEACVNEWVAQAWTLEGVRFVMHDSSRRPAMAFVSFTREIDAVQADTTPPRRPPPLLKAVPGEPEPED